MQVNGTPPEDFLPELCPRLGIPLSDVRSYKQVVLSFGNLTPTPATVWAGSGQQEGGQQMINIIIVLHQEEYRAIVDAQPNQFNILHWQLVDTPYTWLTEGFLYTKDSCTFKVLNHEDLLHLFQQCYV
ncbi:hypothetical protein FISHEDRAFT_59572 [Fistulina hepatica ATCC 64428]|uniref:Uncharacterized protein n=1 Tax=Fistulina hepatica ATCC 64428 TaxID=1128425 RepID=A0A0D7AB17_9AGAR|nr:hypothetical protein FISHEDRAFT_59572 [Fistulina hepatica ATCC 64428]